MIKKFLICFILTSTTLLFGQWEPDQRLTANDSISQTSANSGWCVAAQNDTVHVVWFDYREGGDKIFYRRSTNAGVSWGAETKLTDTAACCPGQLVLSLAVSQPDNIHIVWCDYLRGGDDEIYYKRSTNGGTTWCRDTQLTRDDLRVEADSWTSIATSGSFVHVVWHDYKWDGVRFNWDIFYKRSTDNGATWDPDQRLTLDPGASGPPSVATAGSLVHVAWYDLRDGNAEIYYKRSTDNGLTWSAEARLTNDPAGSYFPSLASQTMSVHVCWYDERDGNWELYFKRSTDAGITWGPDTRLTNDPAYSYRPSVAVSNNNIHVTWYDVRSGNAEIYYKYSPDNGTTWRPDTNLTNNSASSFFPSIAVTGSKVHVVWTDERDGNSEIYYKRNATGNTGIDEKEVSTQKLGVRIRARSNPFVHFTAVRGYEGEYFIVYDAMGREAAKDLGCAIGRNLPAGVYFIRRINDYQLLRIVKLQ